MTGSNNSPALKQIAVGIDDGFTLPLLTLAFSSLPQGATLDWHLFFFERRLTETNQKVIRAAFKYFGISLSLHVEREENIYDSRRHLSTATFLKFRAFEKLGQGTIWMDSDLLLLADWFEVRHWMLKGVPLSAVADDNSERRQFNAGLMVLSGPLKAEWRSAIEAAPKNRSSSDQVIFNLLYSDSYQRLPKRFNYLWGRLITDPIRTRPSIIHYGGANKPWHLPTALACLCISDDCVWRPYLLLQNGMLGSLPVETRIQVNQIAKDTRRIRLRYLKMEALGRQFTYALERLGRIAYPLSILIRLASRIFPAQALHPVHAKRGAFDWPSRVSSNEKE